MVERPKLVVLLTVLSAGVLLFVVLYPYTPTPIATTMGKILAACVLVFAVVPASSTLATNSTVTGFSKECPRLFPSYQLLDLICVRLC